MSCDNTQSEGVNFQPIKTLVVVCVLSDFGSRAPSLTKSKGQEAILE